MPRIQVGKDRQSTFTNVSFPTLPSLKLQPVRTTLLEEKWHHDLLVLQFSVNLPVWIQTLKTGVPVQFTFSQGPYSRDWVGYVSTIQSHTTAGAQEILEVHCAGATYVLKERAPRVFYNQTTVSAVSTIVREFGFNFVGEDNGVIFDQITIAGHSYWEWIVEQAKKLGYGIYVDGMTFYFRPLDSIITSGVTSLPYFTMFGKSIGMNNMQYDRTLDWMHTIHGENVETPGATRAVKNVNGVSPYSQQLLTAIKDPQITGIPVRSEVSSTLFNQINQEHVANTSEAAQLLAEGYAQNSRFNVPAKIKGQGDPRVRVNNPIAVAGTSDGSDGIWIVQKVLHGFTPNHNYQVEMDVVTDGSGETSPQYASKTTNSISGVVNLTDAINNGGRNPNLAASKAYALIVKAPLVSETNQGWNRSPSRWTYSSNGQR